MPPPPPPPPPGPPPPPLNLGGGGKSAGPPKANNDRSKLLSEIQGGKQLKKTVTNDRSAPLVGGKPANSGPSETGSAISGGNSGTKGPVGPSGLGALFANGVPRKPSDVRNKNVSSTSTSPLVVSSYSNTSVSSSTATSQPSRNPSPPKKNVSATVQRLNSPPKTVPKPTSPTESIQSSNSGNGPPPPPPAAKFKPTLPSAPPTVNKPTSQQTQFQTLRPTKANGTAPPPFRRSGSNEEVRPPIAQRPPMGRPNMAPPPPPPTTQKPSFPTAPAVAKKADEPPPPPPPPRTVSYHTATRAETKIDSSSATLPVDQRFRFVPIAELPAPDRFVGFKKDYNFGGGRLGAY